MPLVRYFVFVGGTLLGLLFLADWYFPSTSAATAVADNVDRPIIRIHSSHKWPAAIQLDTTAPVPAASVAAEATVPAAPVERVRQAYAFEPPPQKAPEKVRRRAKPPPRPLSRENSQYFANNYLPPDSRGWPPAGW